MNDLEEVLDRFDALCQKHLPHTDLGQFLRDNPVASKQRSVALIELIAIDMEYRWRWAEPAQTPGEEAADSVSESPSTSSHRARGPLIEDYARRWPEVLQSSAPLIDLIAEEFRIRHRWGDAPSTELYVNRFGDSQPLREALVAAHRELRLDEDEACGSTLESDTNEGAPEAEEETVLQLARLPRYRILKRLGSGGMGKVYLAEDRQLGRCVALKTPFAAEDERLTKRFVNEAKAAALLHHPGICPVFDAGEIDGRPFLTMGFIDGPTLREFWKQQAVGSVGQRLMLLARIADAMQAAHEAGIIHRDLKPSNVMLDASGAPIVMDFGLARRSSHPKAERITQTGDALGSPAYMSPEQVEQPAEQIGPATDIYSLGVMLFEALTGRLPFRGSVSAMLVKTARDSPPMLSDLDEDVDPDLEQLCFQMLAKNPDDRPDSMKVVAQRLRAVADRLSEPSDNIGGRGNAQNHFPWVISLVALALVTALIAVSIHRSGDSPAVSRRRSGSPEPVANDLPATGLPGTTTPAAETPQQVPGFALRFDGVDDHVVTPIVYDGSHPITIEAWLSPADPFGHGTIASNAIDAGIYFHQNYEERSRSRTWSAWIGRAGHWIAEAGRTSHFEHRRTHVAMVWDRTMLAVYVDGQPQGSGADRLGEMPAIAQPFLIGTKYRKKADSGSSNFWFHGEIDEVRISDTARYSGRFSPHDRFTTDDNTLALYHFDEAGGEIAHDASGRENHARIVGPNWVTAAKMDQPSRYAEQVERFFSEIRRPQPPCPGPALSFLDPETHVAAPPLDFDFSQPFTLELWLTPQSSFQNEDWKRIAVQVGPLSLGIQDFHDRYAFQTWTDGRGMSLNSCRPDTALYDRRTHLVGQWDGKQLQLFVNGRRAPGSLSFRRLSSDEQEDHLSKVMQGATAGRLTLGRRGVGASVLGGLIDRFRLSAGARYSSDFEPTHFGVDEQTVVLYDFHEGQGDILHDLSGNGFHADIIGADWVTNSHVTNSHAGR